MEEFGQDLEMLEKMFSEGCSLGTLEVLEWVFGGESVSNFWN